MVSHRHVARIQMTMVMEMLELNWRRPKCSALGLAALLCLSACSSRLERPARDLSAGSCQSFLAQMDRLVASFGVGDAGSARVFRFPYLRINRFLASFAAERPRGRVYAEWVERLRQLDAEARHLELRNLPVAAVERLAASVPGGMTPAASINECGLRLAQRDLQVSDARIELLKRARVRDAYQGWRRIVGLYPLLRWPFAEGVSRLHRDVRESFSKPLPALRVAGRLIRYAPKHADLLSEDEVAEILRRSSQNGLSIPEPQGEELERLFAAFAPIWEMDTVTDDDHIGLVRLDSLGNRWVDPSVAVVYRMVSHARWGSTSLLQLVYLVWQPSRPRERFGDIYAGRFDGIFWRVTLLPSGRPLAYDSIHPCGCYYQLYPGKGFRVVQPVVGSEPVLSPASLAEVKPGVRLVIRLAQRTHFIQRVYADHGHFASIDHDWRVYDELRSLEGPNGQRASLFDPNGLIPDSERLERWLFWPMGIDSAGAMRQWGSHAIAFLGRRHFDDPRLLEGLLRPLMNGQ